ncbi:MAG: hypothetical protein WC870_02800 [Candidatus Paceibacterota bacterium]
MLESCLEIKIVVFSLRKGGNMPLMIAEVKDEIIGEWKEFPFSTIEEWKENAFRGWGTLFSQPDLDFPDIQIFKLVSCREKDMFFAVQIPPT